MVNLKKLWIQRDRTFYDTYMNPETAPYTKGFNELCNHLHEYITTYLANTNTKYLKVGNVLTLEEKMIVNPANIIQSSLKNFKGDRCTCCFSKKGDRYIDGKGKVRVTELDSAHTIMERPAIVREAISESHTRLGYEDWVDILRTFLKLHSKYPVITLCKKCHRAMEKMCVE